jgi:3-hydroxyacyl-CoA dehydrogenase
MSEKISVGVAGSGTMGTGIAIVVARGGFPAVLFDLDGGRVESALGQMRAFFAKSVQRGKLTQAGADDIMSRVSGTTQFKDMAVCGLVIEAVYEELEVKRRLFAQLDAICPAETLFASNTSTLSITEIAAGSGRDDRFVGMHFCLPAQLMKLVEMSPGLNTSEASFARAWALCEAMGQRPVKTQDAPGFILNCSSCRSTTTPSAWSSKGSPSRLRSTAPSRAHSATPWDRWNCSIWWGSIRRCCSARPCTASPTSRAPHARLCSGEWSPRAAWAARPSAVS